MRTQSCKAYAKINLTLDITGRREDGYHEIETVMHTISLCDTVTVKPVRKPGITLCCNLPYVPCDERNIAYKAAAAFFEQTGRRADILIDLRKRIPVGAGMAGGSTDAAAVLRLLNQACGTPLGDKALAGLAVTLGADVPFCLGIGCRLAKGIGERLTRAPSLPPCSIVVAKPKFSISTKGLYEKIDSMPLHGRPDTQAMLDALAHKDLPAVCGNLGNVMEAAAVQDRPMIAQLRQALLDSGAMGARMTGSGSAVYGIFADDEAAKAGREAISGLPVQTWLARPIS